MFKLAQHLFKHLLKDFDISINSNVVNDMGINLHLGSFTYYVTQCRWVGGLQNVTLPLKLEKFYYAKALLEVGGWSKYLK